MWRRCGRRVQTQKNSEAEQPTRSKATPGFIIETWPTKWSTGSASPFDAYYTFKHDEIEVCENQSLQCVTLTDYNPPIGEEEGAQIHICNVDKFINELLNFQAHRARLDKYGPQHG
jgi:hypothetical protein